MLRTHSAPTPSKRLNRTQPPRRVLRLAANPCRAHRHRPAGMVPALQTLRVTPGSGACATLPPGRWQQTGTRRLRLGWPQRCGGTSGRLRRPGWSPRSRGQGDRVSGRPARRTAQGLLGTAAPTARPVRVAAETRTVPRMYVLIRKEHRWSLWSGFRFSVPCSRCSAAPLGVVLYQVSRCRKSLPRTVH